MQSLNCEPVVLFHHDKSHYVIEIMHVICLDIYNSVGFVGFIAVCYHSSIAVSMYYGLRLN